jgi:anti-sigma-K factor RskA
MSLPPDLPPHDEDEALAAEYVLGVLPLDERLAAERRIADDAEFAARVSAWEERLAPLNDEIEEVAAPDILDRVEARLFPAPTKQQAPRRWWPLWLGGLAAGAAAVAVVVQLGLFAPQPIPPGFLPTLSAELVAEEADLGFSALYDPETERLSVTRTAGTPAAEGQDYELWAIGPDGVPASLGLLSAEVTDTEAEGLAPGVVLAVSLEPAGGSTTGAPTGPVLMTGEIGAL